MMRSDEFTRKLERGKNVEMDEIKGNRRKHRMTRVQSSHAILPVASSGELDGFDDDVVSGGYSEGGDSFKRFGT